MSKLDPLLRDRVLERLGLDAAPQPTLEGLRRLYGAWCRHVPFDNLRKLIHLRRGDTGPLPGTDAPDFLEAWLRHGTGGTCWAGHTALHALLQTLGFQTRRGLATMLTGPGLPPNHATVFVDVDGAPYLVDASILHGEPLPVAQDEAVIAHPAWGARWHRAPGSAPVVRWRPVHMPEGLDCRIERFEVPAQTFVDLHEQTRPWSPFNYQLYIRANRGHRVLGIGMGQWTEFDDAGGVTRRALDPRERLPLLVERFGISEELAAAVPADVPMPPPPRP